ncbi:hypothetical protein DFH06DRAFT_1325366 [Mycena polygramma]|nr:hypothetical protein DFH06DRAFT_1325366 [Mycena polygramma]
MPLNPLVFDHININMVNGPAEEDQARHGAEIGIVPSASPGVTDHTTKAYMQYGTLLSPVQQLKSGVFVSMSQGIDTYLIRKGHINPGESFFRKDPPENWPILLIGWIGDRRNPPPEDRSVPACTLTYAQKMIAAICFRFAEIQAASNPAKARVVSEYLATLERHHWSKGRR